MKRILFAIAVSLGLFGAAYAASTINPTVPAPNAPMASAPIRGNFQAAYNDINNVLSKFSNIVAPMAPTTNQDWVNTSSSPWVWNVYDGAQWLEVGTINASTHVFTPVAGGLPGGAAGGDLGGTYPNPTVLNVSDVTGGVLSGANGGTGIANTGETITLGGSFSTSGAYSLGLTLTGATALTLPTTGTLATLAGTETLTNKSISGSANTITNIPLSAFTNVGTATTVLHGNASGSPTFGAVALGTDVSGTLLATNFPALTGDVTNSAGALATTVGKVNGVAYGTSPSTNTVPVVTGTNAITYEVVPNAALANSAITIGGTSTSLGGAITTTSMLDSIGSVQGDILYRSGSNWAVLAPGTSGYLLQSGGASANPSWVLANNGNALFSTVTGNVANHVVTMSNTTVGVQDSGVALPSTGTWTATCTPGCTSGTYTLAGTYVLIPAGAYSQVCWNIVGTSSAGGTFTTTLGTSQITLPFPPAFDNVAFMSPAGSGGTVYGTQTNVIAGGDYYPTTTGPTTNTLSMYGCYIK